MHSDCSLFKHCLLEDGFHSLKEDSQAMYTAFKIQKLKEQKEES